MFGRTARATTTYFRFENSAPAPLPGTSVLSGVPVKQGLAFVARAPAIQSMALRTVVNVNSAYVTLDCIFKPLLFTSICALGRPPFYGGNWCIEYRAKLHTLSSVHPAFFRHYTFLVVHDALVLDLPTLHAASDRRPGRAGQQAVPGISQESPRFYASQA